ncbi:MAG TPA: DtxR family transcriptional regulator [Thermotogota bacterium]|jgi:DtxR family Mn-dependent transcriptional regulator|nr:DtxR family transcriptional regulator [Thermotogota bacterium]NLZ12761.1 DtxR family transcriptional regulator [Thermotogaceae bacterium]MDD8041549.1 DtxR family transcriptional regulator [Thermotogota bacterium]MDD8054095.1 DtxR family transcriptional regulator [Thermotogota bacterium]HNR62693.1 DtxR family transcriptional regulator [Thermotogota bacterium]
MGEMFSESLEDYLLVIYEMEINGQVPRVKNISDTLKKKSTSVIDALKKLGASDLIEYERHSYIKITPKGISKAQRIFRRRMLFGSFLNAILKISPDASSDLAMKLEHIDSEDFYRGLETLQLFFEREPETYKRFEAFSKEHKKNPHTAYLALNKIGLHEKVKVLEIKGSDFVKKRLVAMGFVPGVELEIIGMAPMGDPIEVKIRGYNLALRKDEASNIFVEK